MDLNAHSSKKDAAQSTCIFSMVFLSMVHLFQQDEEVDMMDIFFSNISSLRV